VTNRRSPAVSPTSGYNIFIVGAGVEIGSYKSSPTKYTGPPMDLASMRRTACERSQSFASIDHAADVNVDDKPAKLGSVLQAG